MEGSRASADASAPDEFLLPKSERKVLLPSRMIIIRESLSTARWKL